MAFQEGRYSPATLRRNRIVVTGVTLAGVIACLVAGALTSWPWSNALATSGVVAAFGTVLWWMFASSKAGPVSAGPGTVQRLKRTFWVR